MPAFGKRDPSQPGTSPSGADPVSDQFTRTPKAIHPAQFQSPTGVVIQPIDHFADLIAVEHFCKKIAVSEEGLPDFPIDLPYILEYLRAIWDQPKSTLLVMRNGAGQIVGAGYLLNPDDFNQNYPAMSATEGVISNMYLSPYYRRQDYGSRILEQLEAAARTHGYEKLYLTVSEKLGASQFYAKNGYRFLPPDHPAMDQWSRLKQSYTQASGDPHYVMVKTLTNPPVTEPAQDASERV